MSRKMMRCLLLLAVAANTMAMMSSNGCPNTSVIPGDEMPVVNTAIPGIYVTNGDSNNVLVFELGASGDALPQRTIGGPNTGINLPIGIAKDSQNNLYVANRKGAGVTVYPLDANGDVAPTRTLADPDMRSAESVIVGSGDDVFVANCPTCGSGGGGQTGVFHFATNATASDFRIGGMTNANTGISTPVGIALDENRNLFVANAFNGSVQVFAPGIMGDQLPLRSFNPGSGNTQAIAYANNAVFLSTPGAGIKEFIATASGNSNASAALNPSGLVYPGGIFVDTSSVSPVVYLADYSGDAIYIIQTVGVAPFLTIGSVTTISGPSTGLSGPLGILVVK